MAFVHVQIVDRKRRGITTGMIIALPVLYLKTIGIWLGTYLRGGYHADVTEAELLLKLPGAFKL